MIDQKHRLAASAGAKDHSQQHQ